MLEPGETRQHTEDVAEFSQSLEPPVRKLSHVGWKAEAEKVQEVKVACRMPEANEVAGTTAAIFDRVNRVFEPSRREILEERISCAERKNRKRDALVSQGLREQTVQKFV